MDKIGNLFITDIIISDCNFISNIAGSSYVPYHESNNIIQGGIIFISDVCATFTSQTTFQNNKGVALYISSSTIKFHQSNVNFYSNIGSAILLVGNAYLEINEFNNFTFIENTASYGGAICAIQLQNRNKLYLERCFFKPVHVPNINTSFYFANNKATTGIGDDMFIYNLLPCLDFCGTNDYDFNVSMLFTRNCIGTFTFTNQSVATAPFKVKAKSPVFLYPGVDHKLELQQLDQFSSDVGKIFPVTANIINGSASIASGHVIAFNNSIRIIGTPNTTSTLIIETNILTTIEVAIQVIMFKSSPGFVFNKENQSCQCSAWNDNTSYNGIPYCKHEAVLNIGFWAGYLNNREDVFVTGICLNELCNFKRKFTHLGHHHLPYNRSSLEADVCDTTRHGVLCSECNEHYTLYYHSPSFTCGRETKCHVGFILYFISELVPVTILFLLILFFNVHLTSGALYTLILYAQFLDALTINGFGVIEVNTSLLAIFHMIGFIYGWADLSFFNIEQLSFYVWKGATMMDYFMLKYATTIYALLLVISTVNALKIYSFYACIKLCNKCGRRNIRHSIVNGLSAFLVLCYFQCVHVTFNILTPVALRKAGADIVTEVALFQGELEYMSVQHLK